MNVIIVTAVPSFNGTNQPAAILLLPPPGDCVLHSSPPPRGRQIEAYLLRAKSRHALDDPDGTLKDVLESLEAEKAGAKPGGGLGGGGADNSSAGASNSSAGGRGADEDARLAGVSDSRMYMLRAEVCSHTPSSSARGSRPFLRCGRPARRADRDPTLTCRRVVVVSQQVYELLGMFDKAEAELRLAQAKGVSKDGKTSWRAAYAMAKLEHRAARHALRRGAPHDEYLRKMADAARELGAAFKADDLGDLPVEAPARHGQRLKLQLLPSG